MHESYTFYYPYFWTQYKKAKLHKVRVVYNNVYRKVFGLKGRIRIKNSLLR